MKIEKSLVVAMGIGLFTAFMIWAYHYSDIEQIGVWE